LSEASAAPLPPPSPFSLAAVTLILGGARSGKSAYAESLIGKAATEAIYLATAQALDEEMAERIRHHRETRANRPGLLWRTIEEPLELPQTLLAEAGPERPVLVDCLTLWLSNLLLAGRDPECAGAELIATFPKLAGPVVFVANEVGLGIVPDNPLARQFRDAAGRLNQRVAAAADRVVFLAAGLPLTLKG
jgi:adenosylcobinamide kinase / adenosylcobinamide-phosphate guanylyltransferase